MHRTHNLTSKSSFMIAENVSNEVPYTKRFFQQLSRLHAQFVKHICYNQTHFICCRLCRKPWKDYSRPLVCLSLYDAFTCTLYSGHVSGFLSLVLLRLLACHPPTLLWASIKSSSIRVTTSHHLQIGNRISIAIGQTTLLRNQFL